MKEELLNYHKQHKVGGRSYWKKQLEITTTEDGEGLDLFGMMLTEMAELVYPRDKKKCASQLRQRFLRALPSKIVPKIINARK